MKNNYLRIFKKEIREVFRDRKSLAMMLIIPIMIPLIVLGMSALFDSEMNRDTKEYNKIGFAYKLSENEKELLKSMNVDYIEGSKEDIIKSYEEDKVYVYITQDKSNYTINYNGDDDASALTLNLAEAYIEAYKTNIQAEYLANHKIDPTEVFNIITIDYQESASTSNYFSEYITTYAFLFIIMAITVSATYPATDTTAGEKERGTLETLLTFPIKSRDIILGKLMSVTVSSIITGTLSLILSIVSLAYANNTFEIYKDVNIIPNLPTILLAILIIIVYSLFISGLCLAIASMSKTFKEAQSALTPLTFISFFPSMIAFMINIPTNWIISIIPFLNITQIFTDVNGGNINILHISLMVISTILYISIVIVYIIKQYKSEHVLFSN